MMAIQSFATDNHLGNTVSNAFTNSAGPLSISLWLNATWSTSTLSMAGIYGPASPAAPVTGIQIGSRASNLGKVMVWGWNAGIFLISTNTFADNIWQHIVYTFDGVTHTLYVNGAVENTSTVAQLSGQLNQVYINGYPTGITAETSSAQIDNFLYYNRVLSSNEVLTIYNAEGYRHGIVNGLVAGYEFNNLAEGATVISVTDLSGNNNALLPIGAGASPTTYVYAGTYVTSNTRMVQ
jgi:hypothetical protein